MPARLLRILLAVACINLAVPFKASASDEVPTVVIFFSLDHNLPAYRSFVEGLALQFSTSDDVPYNVIIEYMDLTRFPDTSYIQNVVERYNDKYASIDLDVIVTFGPNALAILVNQGFEAITSSNIVNIDIEDNIPPDINSEVVDSDRLLNIRIETDYKQTLEAAFALFPSYTDVYIVSGSSPADQYFAELTRQATADFKQSHNFKYCQGTTLDSSLAFIRQVPENSIVFVTSFIEDSKQVPFSTAMIVRAISAQCKAPLFTLSDEFLAGKAIGGYVYSFVELGKQTEQIINGLVSGSHINDFTVDENSFNKYMYDWEMLCKWGVEDSPAIPRKSEIYNRNESFVSKYKWYLLATLLFILSQSYLILLLFKLYRKQAAVAAQREKNELLYRQMVHEDRHTRMSALAGALSHELNQPLTAILYNAQAAQRFLASGKLTDELTSEILANIVEDDKRAAGLISSLRGFMKLEVREHEQVDMNSIILDTLNIFHAETIAQHIEVRYQSSKEPVNVFGDKVQLQQVMLNLLFNAENAMADNGPTAKTIDIDLQCEKSSALITILDSGPGVKESIKDTLFKPFVTSSSNGMGIGLAISKSIVESHQGTIMVENHPKGGAQFSVKLPLFNHGA